VARLLADPDKASESAWALFGKVSRRLGQALEPETFDQTSDLDEILNLRFDCSLDDVPAQLSGMFVKRARLRLALLRMGGWDLLPGQLLHLGRDLFAARAARLAFKRLGREAFRTVKPPLHRLVAQGLAGSAS
jgi:hypothetical protein